MKTFPRMMLVLAILLLVQLSCGGQPALKFTPEELPAGQVGQAYAAEITVSENETPVDSFIIEEGALPAGLTFEWAPEATTAFISGTPEEAGEFSLTVVVRCLGTNTGGQEGKQSYTLVVAP